MLTSGLSTKAMLYGAGVPNREMMKSAPQVGIATVWWEGNPLQVRVPLIYANQESVADLSRTCSTHRE